MGCGDSSCLTQLANALGADYILSGTFGRLGSGSRLDLKLLDTAHGLTLAAFGEQLPASDDQVSRATSGAVQTVFVRGGLIAASDAALAGPPTPVTQPAGGLASSTQTAPATPSRVPAYATWGAASALAVGWAVAAVVASGSYSKLKSDSLVANGRAAFTSEQSTLRTQDVVADTLLGTTVVAAAVGTYLYFWPPGASDVGGQR
jgi:hypothetical protein